MAIPAPAVNRQLYIGLMSGTSLDGIDAVLIDLSDTQYKLLEAVDHAIPAQLQRQLIELCQPGDNEIDRLGRADRALAVEFSLAVKSLLQRSGYQACDIIAIGSHGQTIRHRPPGSGFSPSFTLQIGDPNTIAYQTGITTVADFRRRDIAAGGQGAPLAPAFHQAAFHHQQLPRIIINIGGMANISVLNPGQPCLGFDTGPGNILMDGWIQQCRQQPYDSNGDWAAQGIVIDVLLGRLLDHPYLTKAIPKSTGREDFHLSWLAAQVGQHSYLAEDIQATLLEFTAQTIKRGLDPFQAADSEIFICGGGAYNQHLMSRLSALLQPHRVDNTDKLGIAAHWVEGACFAWLAKQTLEKTPANLIEVSGAEQAVILGAIYPC